MLKGRTAVVTGASRGIGKAVALKFAEMGADVAIIYASNDEAANSVRGEAERCGVRASAYKCDAADYEQVKAVCDSIIGDFGGVDILVNNAGVTRDKLLLRMEESDFDVVVGVSLKGAFNFTRHLARSIMKSGHGRIINISSVSGLSGNAGQANYSAAKAALVGLTKTTARELASRLVTCNAIAPGFIDTDMTSGLSDELKKLAIDSIPLKRMGSASEVAELALFLASDAAAYITGEIIKIDGGLYI